MTALLNDDAPNGQRQRQARSTWRIALAAAITLFTIGITWLLIERADPPTAMARLATESGAPLWNVATFEDGARLRIDVAGAVRAEAGRDYELWALPESGAPVSLGVITTDGDQARDLTPIQQAALRASAKLAVSLEPIGGSPTGAPTGPVLYVAQLMTARTPT